MDSTQSDLPVVDIKNNIVSLKGGDFALILQTSAVNFGLLSENEQIAIIAGFAGFLNSLSFPVQILVRSKRLDITSYLQKLNSAYSTQANPLLAQLIAKYKTFIEKIIRENEVLDKQFYVIVPLWYYELGALPASSEAQTKKALTTLIPRRDHIIRQLSMIGLQARQLNNEELVRLFYDIYNQPSFLENQTAQASAQTPVSPEKQAGPAPSAQPPPQFVPVQPQQPASPNANRGEPAPAPVQFKYPPNLPAPTQPGPMPTPVQTQPLDAPRRLVNPRTPFVVEELADEYGANQQ